MAVEAKCAHDASEEKQSEWILWDLKQQGKRTLAAKVVLHGWLRQNLLQKNCFFSQIFHQPTNGGGGVCCVWQLIQGFVWTTQG